jgi:hypothetical protein
MAAFAVAGCQPAQSTDYEAEYGGNPAIYERIASLSDCDELQAEFDIAADINDRAEPGTPAHRQSTGYMGATDARMQEVGCY